METYTFTSTSTSTSTSASTSTPTPDVCPIPSLPLHRLSISSPPPPDAELPLSADLSTSTSPYPSPATSISSWTSSPYQPISPVLTPDPHVQEIHEPSSSHSNLHESHSSHHLHQHSSSSHLSLRPIPHIDTDIPPIPSPHRSTCTSHHSSPLPICFSLTRKRNNSYDTTGSNSPIPKRIRCDDEIGPYNTSSSSYITTNSMYNPSSRAKQYIRSPHIISPSLIHHSPSFSPSSSSPSSPRPSSPAPTMTLPSHRILLIDTTSASRIITYTQLSQMGWNVDVTHTWEMAFDLWQQHHYRVVLCDMGESKQILMEPDEHQHQHIPCIDETDHDGILMQSLTRFINIIRTYDHQHKQERHTIILGVSSHLTPLQQQHCVNMGMDGCMEKGMDMGRTLVDTLESTWTKRQQSSTPTPLILNPSRRTPTPLVLNSSISRRPSLTNISSPHPLTPINISSPHTPPSIFASEQS